MNNSIKIVLRGHGYAAPRAESIEIINQGVLCASVDPTSVSSSEIEVMEEGGWF